MVNFLKSFYVPICYFLQKMFPPFSGFLIIQDFYATYLPIHINKAK